jgi:hypothetical protein
MSGPNATKYNELRARVNTMEQRLNFLEKLLATLPPRYNARQDQTNNYVHAATPSVVCNYSLCPPSLHQVMPYDGMDTQWVAESSHTNYFHVESQAVALTFDAVGIEPEVRQTMTALAAKRTY